MACLCPTPSVIVSGVIWTSVAVWAPAEPADRGQPAAGVEDPTRRCGASVGCGWEITSSFFRKRGNVP